MAERATTALAARLVVALDKNAKHALIALDEGAEPDEVLNPKLAERLAFHADLSDCAIGDAAMPDAERPTIPLSDVAIPPDTLPKIIRIASELGIDSMRAPLFKLRAARAHAALFGRNSVTSNDLEVACALTLAHRATRLPETATEEEPPAPPPDQSSDDSSQDNDTLDLPDELLLEALRALLPDNLHEQLAAQRARAGRGNGTRAARKGNRRGRSLVQTKRRLAALPGGGGTPLAAGLMSAFEQAAQATRRRLTPTIAILTDGRANIALDGTANRKQAAIDAQQIARVLRAHGTDAIVIDTGNRPEPALRSLAQTLNATYLPLPRANVEKLSKSVATVLGS